MLINHSYHHPQPVHTSVAIMQRALVTTALLGCIGCSKRQVSLHISAGHDVPLIIFIFNSERKLCRIMMSRLTSRCPTISTLTWHRHSTLSTLFITMHVCSSTRGAPASQLAKVLQDAGIQKLSHAGFHALPAAVRHMVPVEWDWSVAPRVFSDMMISRGQPILLTNGPPSAWKAPEMLAGNDGCRVLAGMVKADGRQTGLRDQGPVPVHQYSNVKHSEFGDAPAEGVSGQ